MTALVISLRAHRLARLLRKHCATDLAATMLASVVDREPTQQKRIERLRSNHINGLVAASLLVQSGHIVREPCESCGVECLPKTAWVWRSEREEVWHRYCGRACGERALGRKEVV
jgi:hypothetical protein